MERADARLIGLDWGTSALRVYLLGVGGSVLAERTYPWGILSVPDADFAAAYHAAVGDWHRAMPHLAAVAAGMIGSTEGWVRAPYCCCPTGAPELAAALVGHDTPRDGRLSIVPGVERRGPFPNVMRGEETQIIGALALQPELADAALLILPGTHSKWVVVDDGRIARFDTYLTGELYAVLREHSILGRPARNTRSSAPAATTPEISWEAFARGVELARERAGRGIAPLLFLTRTLVLNDELGAHESLDFLSGLLIGEELASALSDSGSGVSVVNSGRRLALIGSPALCARYERALEFFGFAGTPLIDGSAPAGLWEIARQADLVMPNPLQNRSNCP